jgi:hypothetical protein
MNELERALVRRWGSAVKKLEAQHSCVVQINGLLQTPVVDGGCLRLLPIQTGKHFRLERGAASLWAVAAAGVLGGMTVELHGPDDCYLTSIRVGCREQLDWTDSPQVRHVKCRDALEVGAILQVSVERA